MRANVSPVRRVQRSTTLARGTLTISDRVTQRIGHAARALPAAALLAVAFALVPGSHATGQTATDGPVPPGRLIDLGGYRVHLLCTGPTGSAGPTVVLSIGAGGFAADWSLVQQPLSDSMRVCSYDRPGFGWSDAGPTPRTLAQEAFELRSALQRAGERSPFVLVGQSLGGFVVRRLAEAHPGDVSAVVLVEPANENGYLGYRGQWVIPRTLASARPVPAVRSFAESPPLPVGNVDPSSCQAGGDRSVRLFRCFVPQDDYFAEEMAAFYDAWTKTAHPLGDVPLVVITGTRPRPVRPGLTAAQLRADSVRVDLSRLSSRSRAIDDSASGHHVQRDNPRLIVDVVRAVSSSSRSR
jgi:pimeloyl-ACP methyl ester carboxylesterase